MVTLLTQMHGSAVFDAQPSPTMVLDRDLVVRAVNQAHVAATGRCADELIGVNAFDAFPANPEAPRNDGVTTAQQSMERVLRSGRPHRLWMQRYDIRDPQNPGAWLTRYWTPVNAPVRHDGRVIGIVARIEDVTPVHENLLGVLEQYP